MALVKGGGAVAPDKIQTNDKVDKVVLNNGSHSVEFTTDNVLQGYIDSSGNIVFGTASGAQGLDMTKALSTTNYGMRLQNTSTGDVKLTLALAAQNYSLGIDNSDNDKFKISTSETDVGSGTLFTLDTSGNATFTGTLDAGTNSIINVVDPTADQHAATKKYVDDEITSSVTSNNELSELTDVTITSLTSSQMLYADSASSWANSNSLTWDETNNLLQVVGDSGTSGLKAENGSGYFSHSYVNGNEVIFNAGHASLTNAQVQFKRNGTTYMDFSAAGVLFPQTALFQNGAVSTPSIALSTYTSTGLYSPSANTIAVAANGILSTTFNSDGIELAAKKITSTFVPNANDVLTNKLYVDSTFQAIDDVLTDLSALSVVSTDQMIYGTGAGVFGYSTLTSFARTLLDDTDAATARTTLGAQEQDAGLDSIAGLTTTAGDMIYTTASDTYATTDLTAFARTLLDDIDAPTARTTLGLTIGTNVQAWDTDLDALAGLSSTGLIVRTGAGTATTRSVVESTTAGIVVTNGDGVAGNPSIAMEASLDNLANLDTTVADKLVYTLGGNSWNTTVLTAYSRSLLDDASASAWRTTLELDAGQAGDIWVEKAGDTMTGLLTLSGNPTSALHAVPKQYVDGLASGLDPKESVKGATTQDISGTYSSVGGAGGSGNFTGVDLTSNTIFDDVPTASTYAISDRILIKNQTDPKQNGIYIVTTAGATGVIERASDHDGTPTNEVSSGNSTFVELGTTYSGQTWSLQGNGELALNTDNLDWQLISNAADWTWGDGLFQSGNTIAVDLEGAGSAGTLGTMSFNGNNVAVDLGLTSTTAMPGNATLANLSNVTESGLADGHMLYNNSGTWQNASQIYWDDTNNRLGIGESTPASFFHVNSGLLDLAAIFESTDSEVGIQLIDNAGSTKLQTVGSTFSVLPGSSVSSLDITTTESKFNTDVRILDDGPVLYIQDSDSTGIAQTGFLSFRDSANTENAVFGYLSSGSTDFNVSNVIGDFNVITGGATRLTVADGSITSTVPIRISDGSQTVPSITFSDDVDTGIFSSTNDNLDFTVNGLSQVNVNASRVSFTNSIQVADGSAALPSYRFGTDQDSGMFSAGANQIGFSTGTVERAKFTGNGLEMSSGNQIYLQALSAAAPSLTFGVDTDTGLYHHSTNTLGLAAGGVAVAGIDTQGYGNSISGTATQPSFFWRNDSNTGLFNLADDVIRFSAGGSQYLSVSSSAIDIVNGANLVLANSCDIAFSGTTDSAVIRGQKSVYINIDADNSSGAEIFAVNKDATTPGGGTQLFRVQEDGTIQLSTYGAGTLSTDASGNISASDARLKDVLSREVIGRDTIMALNPVWYDWKEDSGFRTEFSELGFTAQSVAEVIPEAAPGTDETVEIRNYHDRAIIASLVKHNQELEENLEEKDNQINEMQSTLQELMTRLSALESK